MEKNYNLFIDVMFNTILQCTDNKLVVWRFIMLIHNRFPESAHNKQQRNAFNLIISLSSFLNF